tara:strand:- start:799 stop:1032 length:234 start_codon:yes stop_codon:yes gene_type:complete
MTSPVRLVNTANNDDNVPVQDDQSSHLILAENLMLQRIVESIRSDVTDSRWVLSGKVTEFFGENRMVISTAQRSNAE